MTIIVMLLAFIIGGLAVKLRETRIQKKLKPDIERQERVIAKYEPIRQREALEAWKQPEAVFVPTGGIASPDFDYGRLKTILRENGYEVLSDEDLLKAVGGPPDLFPEDLPDPATPEDLPDPGPENPDPATPEDPEKTDPDKTTQPATKSVTKRKKPKQRKKTEDKA